MLLLLNDWATDSFQPCYNACIASDAGGNHMLDQIDLERSITKQEYKRRLRELQQRLYDMQQALFEARRPAVIVFEGWAGTSKIGTIGQLTRRLDPRGLRVHPVTPPRTFETLYPWLYRFWLKTPSYGELAIFDRSWYRQVLADRTEVEIAAADWLSRCEDIVSFERHLADDGAVILKFWLHISKHEQARRFQKLESDRLTAWQVTDEDRWQHKHYDRMLAAVEDLLPRTDTPYAPWVTLAATDKRYMRIAVLETVLSTLETRLGRVNGRRAGDHDDDFDDSGAAFRRSSALQPAHRNPDPPTSAGGAEGRGLPNGSNGQDSAAAHASDGEHKLDIAPRDQSRPEIAGVLGRVDLNLRLEQKTYERELKELQARLHLLGLEVYRQHRPVMLVFEGWDAAGKGGAIKRLTEKLDPRGYIVHAIAAPAGEDKSHHYLYRFWLRLPARGEIAIFDRSWYGRVLVERIEGFAREDEWQRAYAEINEFERQLVEFGTIVCKFWLHISPDEQLRRFEERKNVPYKAWKLTDDDWRNREQWPRYEQAIDEMVLRTSTPAAPWTVVESENKPFARIKVLRTVVRRLEEELGRVKL
jgi:AMP-polyphosphate phosphotransferase